MQQSPLYTAPASDTKMILIEVKNVYGELKVYPVCPRARCFADIAGTKTLTHAALCLIEQLGYAIVDVKRSTWREAR